MLPNTKPYTLTKEDFEAGKKLYYRFIKGEIDNFDLEVAHFALLCGFDELVPHPEPTRPTQLAEYDNLSPFQQRKVGDEFFRQPEVLNYLKDKTRIKYINKSNKEWLQELVVRFDKAGDKVNAEKVRIRLNEFR